MPSSAHLRAHSQPISIVETIYFLSLIKNTSHAKNYIDRILFKMLLENIYVAEIVV